ncbi:hypothetical protein ACI2LF_13815 [Kribbella sp. NPDC020789]
MPVTNPEYHYPAPKLDVPTLATGSAEAAGDDSGAELLQAGASALGGAGSALGGLWLYRRRRAPVVRLIAVLARPRQIWWLAV